MPLTSEKDQEYRKYAEGRLAGLRVNRYSFWTHWRELGDYYLPRRYKWVITPNQAMRGSPINQHIIDNTGTIAARDLASGFMSGVSSPVRPWFSLKVGMTDTTSTTETGLWLSECRRLMMLVFQLSNFYNSIAQLWADLVVFGTGAMLIHEDFDDVIRCQNPCLGEYYVDNDDKMRPVIFNREFTLTIDQVVNQFGYDNCSVTVKTLYDDKTGAGKTKEIVVAHSIEPNNDPKKWGFPSNFAYREIYWEYGATQGGQGGGTNAEGLLRKKGFFEQCAIVVRWDITSNEAYGRSPAMEALGDVKQLQLETRRKAQAIDKMVNPPMVADIQLKNQPASLLPGGMTYVSNYSASGKPGFSSAYDTKFPVNEISEDLAEVRERIKRTFFNNIFQVISQYETRSNVSATEIDARRAEALIMLGPVLERSQTEGLAVVIDRVWGIMQRAGIFPPPPEGIAGQNIEIEYISMLATAQDAAAAGGIERTLGLAGNMAGVVGPEILDKIDTDYALDKYSSLMNNDPRMMRTNDQVAAIRQKRMKDQQQAQQVEMAEKLAAGAKTLSETDVGGGVNALQQLGGPGLGAV